MTKEELDLYVKSFPDAGFSGAVNWYRNFSRNWESSPHLTDFVPHRSLMIVAELDRVVLPSMTNGMEKYVPNLERVLIAGSGHWTQQEKPLETNQAIAEWMARL